MSSSSSSSSSLSGNVTRQITLTPYFQKDFAVNSNTGCRLQVIASDAVGFDERIFLYVQTAVDATTGNSVGVWQGVCSWSQMASVWASAPDPTADPPYFREDRFDVVVDTELIAHQLWNAVQADVATLVASMNAGDVLETGAPVVIGA